MCNSSIIIHPAYEFGGGIHNICASVIVPEGREGNFFPGGYDLSFPPGDRRLHGIGCPPERKSPAPNSWYPSTWFSSIP